MKNINLLNYQISCRGAAGDVEFAWQFIKSGGNSHYMACANPHSLVVASKDALFESALKNVDILVPDGTGILIKCWTSRRNMEIMP